VTRAEVLPDQKPRKRGLHSAQSLTVLDTITEVAWRNDAGCVPKTPMQTFVDSLSLARDKMLDARYGSGAEQAVPQNLPGEGRGEGGAEEWEPPRPPHNYNPNVGSSLSFYNSMLV
jgi:hypothetical protein